jgi:superfamily II DNA or RNA helicase
MDIQEDPVIVPRKVDIRLSGDKQLRPDQVGPVDFLSKDEVIQRGLELQTGKGKTLIAIHVMANLGYASMIICSGLVDQWMQMIKENTEVEELYVIKAFSSIADLVKSDYYPTIMVCSLETLRLYSQCAPGYKELPYSYDGFLEHYGIGTKIVDEVHENYQAVAIMDLFSRVRNNIYMSATFRRSRDAENKIFSIIYPPQIRYGGVAYVKYTKLTFYAYVSGVPEQKTVTQRGYNQARFEAYLMKRPTKLETFFRSVLFVCIDVHYLRIRHEKQKCLIYVNTIQMAQVTQKTVQEHYPKLVVKTYISDDSEDNYADGVDVIVSIPMKSATGRDISNLRTVINVVSTSSSVLLEQMFGRLRKIPGVVTEFISVYDESSRAQIRHHESVVEVLGPRSVSMNTHHLY